MDKDSPRKGYARVCVLLDMEKCICPGERIRTKNNYTWQQFIYEELSDLCYHRGLLGRTLESCGCMVNPEVKPLHGPWIHAAWIPVAPLTAPTDRRSPTPTPAIG